MRDRTADRSRDDHEALRPYTVMETLEAALHLSGRIVVDSRINFASRLL
jgi:hypothetical protein